MSRSSARYAEPRRHALKRAAAPLFCVLVLFYFGFHAVSGDRGVLALLKETRHLEALKAELAEVTAKRESMEKRVKLLSSSSLDLDLLDEQARLVLGLAGNDEVVILLNDPVEQ